jgi:hypothetical protein
VLPVLPKILSEKVVMTVGVFRHDLVEGVVTIVVVSPWVGLMERGFFWVDFCSGYAAVCVC